MLLRGDAIGFWFINDVIGIRPFSLVTFIGQQIIEDDHYDGRELMSRYTFLSPDGKVVWREMTEKQVSQWFKTIA